MMTFIGGRTYWAGQAAAHSLSMGTGSFYTPTLCRASENHTVLPFTQITFSDLSGLWRWSTGTLANKVCAAGRINGFYHSIHYHV